MHDVSNDRNTGELWCREGSVLRLVNVRNDGLKLTVLLAIEIERKQYAGFSC